MKKKLICVVTVFWLLMTTTLPTAYATAVFTDVSDGSVYDKPIQWAVDNSITRGVTQSSFSPNAVCSRQQIITFLWRANGGIEYDDGKFPFADMSSAGDFGKAAMWAYRQGLESGRLSEDGKLFFDPYTICTRRDAILYLWRLEGTPSANTDVLQHFDDIAGGVSPDMSAYRQSAAWALNMGITNGITQSTFCPYQFCTRAQTVTFLYRYYQAKNISAE